MKGSWSNRDKNVRIKSVDYDNGLAISFDWLVTNGEDQKQVRYRYVITLDPGDSINEIVRKLKELTDRVAV